MKKNLSVIALLVLTCALLSSCSSRLALKGSYPQPQHYAETTLTQEEVWTKVIDYFATAGVPITTIDKSSGLIVSSKMSFLDNYTREKDGKPMNPNAYVVIPTVRGGFGNILEPTAVITGDWAMIGDWNVRIKADGDVTQVYINLMNMDCYYSTSGLYGNTTRIPIKSTGVFEKSLLDFLTK